MTVPGFDSAKRMELAKVSGDRPYSQKVTQGVGSADVAVVSSKGVARLCFERCTAGG